MKTLRPLKRSVSPFGAPPADVGLFQEVKDAFSFIFSSPESPASPFVLEHWNDASSLPVLIEKLAEAPANDAPQLGAVCEYAVGYWYQFEEKKLAEVLYASFLKLFGRKTELFLVDYHDKAQCEKMEWEDEHRDVVLFAKERDILIERFFAPLSEKDPNLFSEFIQMWIETDNLDRILHFLDFSARSKNPSLDCQILFTQPVLRDILRNKALLRSLFEKAKPLLEKLSSPTWETNTRHALDA